MICFKRTIYVTLLMIALVPMNSHSSFTDHAQSKASGIWSKLCRSDAGMFISAKGGDMQAWVVQNPLFSGVVAGSVVFATLFYLWKEIAQQKVDDDNVEALKKGFECGYSYAQGEYAQKSSHALRAAKIEAYYEGWVAAMQKFLQDFGGEEGSQEKLVAELLSLFENEDVDECELRIRSGDVEFLINVQPE